MNVIDIKNLYFSYPENSGETVLENVNFTLKSGASCCIIGPNGGGKSTLLHLILGFLSPTSGEISVLGTTPRKANPQIGFMAQYFKLDPLFPITVREVVLAGRLHGVWPFRFSRRDRKTADGALEELGLGALADKSFASLSGGQRQRVLLARALACSPKLLLLDEPTANIDPGAEQDFYETLRELRRKLTLITVSHDLGFVGGDEDQILCVNKFVSFHEAGKFDAESAKSIYRHEVKLVHHDHSCFCPHCDRREAEEHKEK